MGRFARGREGGAVPGWSSRYIWGSSGTLSSRFRKGHIGGIRYVLVPRKADREQDFIADRAGAIEGGMLPFTVDAESGDSIAASYHRLLKTYFRAAWVSTSMGRTVVKERADGASLCLSLA